MRLEQSIVLIPGGFCVGAAKSCKSFAALIYRETALIYRETEPIYRETALIYRETALIYPEAEQMLSPDARSTQTESEPARV